MRESRLPYIIAAFVVGAVFVWWLTRGTPPVNAPVVSPDVELAEDDVAAEYIPVGATPIPHEQPPVPSPSSPAEVSREPTLRVTAVDAVTGAAILPFEAFLSFYDHTGESETQLASAALELSLSARYADSWRRPRRGEQTVTLWPPLLKPSAVYARAEGYTAAAITIPPLSEGESRDVTVRLDPGAPLRILVTDKTGAAIPDAEVSFSFMSGESAQSFAQISFNPDEVTGGSDDASEQSGQSLLRFVTLGKTDTEGFFEARLPADRPLQIRATCDGYETIHRNLALVAGHETTVALALNEWGVVAGVVTHRGVPVEGAVVESDTTNKERAFTNADGAYVLKNLPDGEYNLTASLKEGAGLTGEPQLRRRAEVVRNHATQLDFAFGANTAVLLGVVDFGGQAPQSALIFGNANSELGSESVFLTADQTGYFEGEVPAGNLYVTLIANLEGTSNPVAYQARIDCALGATVRRDFHFDAVKNLSVRASADAREGLVLLVVLHEEVFSPELLGHQSKLFQNSFIQRTQRIDEVISVPVAVESGKNYVVVVSLDLPGSESDARPYQYQRLEAGSPSWDVHFEF